MKIVDETLAGIEAECRAIQSNTQEDLLSGPDGALEWWQRNFAHIYPLYEYDAEKERVVRRGKEV